MSEYMKGYDKGFVDGYKNEDREDDISIALPKKIKGYRDGWEDGFKEKQYDMESDQ